MNGASYVETIVGSKIRLRVEIETDQGTVSSFLVQLEYHLDGEWCPVVRFDHNPDSEIGHDITEEGLHMDIYREGEVVRRQTNFPPVSLNTAPRYSISYIKEELDRLIQRFEEWHDITDKDSRL